MVLIMNGSSFDLVNNKVLDHSAISSVDHFKGLDAAATKLQKAYKNYRTRRNLAGCTACCGRAMPFDGARLSFFDSDRSETAASRWARARTRAAKVGKGLSKSEKAQGLDLTHWIEAVDPRHRYGQNLHFYYNFWFHSDSSQPFFFWLDIGEGKGVNLDACSRTQLQSQRVKYLGKQEREEYEVVVEGEKLLYKKSRLPVDTVDGSKWIFVLSASRKLYVGKKRKGLFQHSSFLSGGAAIAAQTGIYARCTYRIRVLTSIIDPHDSLSNSSKNINSSPSYDLAIWAYSGHYRPAEENFLELICFLEGAACRLNKSCSNIGLNMHTLTFAFTEVSRRRRRSAFQS
uniref:Uncharacterized protein n=1 Tax=Salix viminalis TaxID=40686 RepID=A0A6N2N4M3_SALVM